MSNRSDGLLARLMAQTQLPEIALGLERVEQALARVGNPHLRLPPVIHIAGTNGKGSTQAYLRAMLEANSKRVHAYTSPHLVRFHERITLAGQPIEDALLCEVLEEIESHCAGVPLTFFEATTIAAFMAFSRVEADVLLLEVGLGGRLDATNVVPSPMACVITPIAEDHKEFLGDSIAAIAREKAGIIKSGARVIVAEQLPEARGQIQQACTQHEARASVFGSDWNISTSEVFSVVMNGANYVLPEPALAGVHQRMNAATAFVTLWALRDRLRLDMELSAQAIAKAAWPARLQQLQSGPLVALLPGRGELWLDGGHNPHAAQALAAWIKPEAARTGLIIGMMARKDEEGFLAAFAPLAIPIAVISMQAQGGADAAVLLDSAQKAGCDSLSACSDLEESVKWLLKHDIQRILIAGSLYLAGNILKNHT